MSPFRPALPVPATTNAAAPAARALPRRRRLPLAVAHALLLWLLLPPAPSAEAGVITLTGPYWMDPWDPAPLGPGDINLPSSKLWVGSSVGMPASFSASAGASVQLAVFGLGVGGGSATGLLDGPGTVLQLGGSQGRLVVGEFGSGSLTVANGAHIDAVADSVQCHQAHVYCGAIVGASAGSSGSLTVTDYGSTAAFVDPVIVGSTYLSPNYGTPGGATSASVSVLNGARIFSDALYVGNAAPTALSQGTETVNASVLIDGAYSIWYVGPVGSERSVVEAGNGSGTYASLSIQHGGTLQIFNEGSDHGLNLGIHGGSADMRVGGAGSLLQLAAGSYLNLGSGGGNGSLWIEDGASLVGGRDIHLGDNNGSGTLVISGPGASALFDPDSQLHVGSWNTGYGTLTVRDGGHVQAGTLWLGDGGGSGSMTVRGTGSRYDSLFPAGPGNDIQVGIGGYGQLLVTDGGAITARGIGIGNEAIGGGPGGSGSVTVSGAGSSITLDATQWHRLGLENGTLTVSAGGLFDAGAGQEACWQSWCGAFIGANAGADANVVVTGTGSRAVFASDFRVGAAYATSPPATPYTLGIPGAATHAKVLVLDGGRLETTAVKAGIGSSGNAALGNEPVDVVLKVSGSGSTWAVTGIPGATSAASFTTGTSASPNVHVALQILDGGKLQLGQAGQQFASMTLGANGGHTGALVSGNGSAIEFLSDDSSLNVGRHDAYASLSFEQGAQLAGLRQLIVGAQGGTGEVNFNAASANLDRSSFTLVGFAGGTGSLNLTHGAVVNLGGNAQDTELLLGYGGNANNAQGSLLIDGASLQMHSRATDYVNADGNYNSNPFLSLGYNGAGTLTIRNGGALVMQGDITPRPDDFNHTAMVAGAANAQHAGYGSVLVSGAGSLLEVKGSYASIHIAPTAGAIGQLAVQDGAMVRTTWMELGNEGGSGSLNVDRAGVALSGQFGAAGDGARLQIGTGSGSFGSTNLTRGAALDISNGGSSGASLVIGSQGGTGVLNASGGSQIHVSAAPGLAYASLGGDAGSNGIMLLNHSGLDVGDGKVLLAPTAGSNAALTMSDNATLQAGYVGVGSTSSGDGGSARLIVNGSTLVANLLEVGSQGYVGGNGVLQAAVINRGTISPGNSPGTLTINGSFLNQSGGKLLLEIAADGSGGYVTDHLIFTDGSAIAMSGLQVTFRFLGAADPNVFLAGGGFNIDRFIEQQDAGGVHGLDHSLFGGVSYAARSDDYRFSDFTFSADGGASFTAAPVPEPEAWAMLLAGLGGFAAWARRRQPA